MRLPFWYSFGIVQAKGGTMALFLAVDGGGTGCRAALADAQGRMVSFIQSNFKGFGSGVVVPGTGIALQKAKTKARQYAQADAAMFDAKRQRKAG